MPARVQVRAVIWVGEQIVVHSIRQQGALRVTLPGGRVNERESVVDALKREVLEETGIEVEVGDLMFSAEVLSGARRQDVELIFACEPLTETFPEPLELIDPEDPDLIVLPPVLDEIVASRNGTLESRWLGNIYKSPAALEPSGADD